MYDVREWESVWLSDVGTIRLFVARSVYSERVHSERSQFVG